MNVGMVQNMNGAITEDVFGVIKAKRGIEMDKFHEHLDKCEQCRNHPFDLCEIGQKLLIESTKNISDEDISGYGKPWTEPD